MYVCGCALWACRPSDSAPHMQQRSTHAATHATLACLLRTHIHTHDVAWRHTGTAASRRHQPSGRPVSRRGGGPDSTMATTESSLVAHWGGVQAAWGKPCAGMLPVHAPLALAELFSCCLHSSPWRLPSLNTPLYIQPQHTQRWSPSTWPAAACAQPLRGALTLSARTVCASSSPSTRHG
jgi:hypothetical protein